MLQQKDLTDIPHTQASNWLECAGYTLASYRRCLQWHRNLMSTITCILYNNQNRLTVYSVHITTFYNSDLQQLTYFLYSRGNKLSYSAIYIILRK